MGNTIFRSALCLIIILGLLCLNSDLHLYSDESNDAIQTEVKDTTSKSCTEDSNTASSNLVTDEAHHSDRIEQVESTAKMTSEISDQELADEKKNGLSQEPQTSTTLNKQPLTTTYSEEPNDPLESKPLSSKDILDLLSSSIVTATEGYSEHYGNDTINVFATNISDYFSVNTAVWYNMWGGNQQELVINPKQLQDFGQLFQFTIGCESGGKGDMTIQIYGDSEDPIYDLTLQVSEPPITKTINISKINTLKIVVINNASVQNKAVFYNFKLTSEEEVTNV